MLATKLIAGIVAVLGSIPLLSSTAFANPVPPPSDTSYYIYTSTTVLDAYTWGCNQAQADAYTWGCNQAQADAYTWGCNQAQADASTGHNSLVVFDDGAQTGDGAYTVQQGEPVTDSSYWLTVGWDEQLAEQFALGYQNCGSHQEYTDLAMGTNNSAGTTNSSTGVAWGQTVQAAINNIVSANYVNATIYGAGDWESWGHFSDVSNWEGGYVSATSANIVDFGSADGCTASYNPETTDQVCSYYPYPNNTVPDWTQNDYVLVSWGWTPALALPQIYFNGSSGCPYPTYPIQDIQWGMISLRGVNLNNGTGPIYFSGPLGTNGTCEPPNGAYIDLWNVINNTPSTAMTPYYLGTMS